MASHRFGVFGLHAERHTARWSDVVDFQGREHRDTRETRLESLTLFTRRLDDCEVARWTPLRIHQTLSER